MGGQQSVIPGGGSEGYHVLRVSSYQYHLSLYIVYNHKKVANFLCSEEHSLIFKNIIR